MKYQNFETLKKNSEFKSVYQAKHSYANKYIIMYILQNGTDTNRLGVSVSKKVGNSIVRHRLARLIREAFRLNVTQVAPGYDVVVIARAGLKGKGYKETESAMLHLLKLHHISMKKVIIKLIHFYQRAVSPYKGRSMCIYYPTCSQYALEAVEQYGALKGGWMAFKRILRCNPFAKGGYDPVPIVYKPKKGKH